MFASDHSSCLMKFFSLSLMSLALYLSCAMNKPSPSHKDKIVIAHRGASGYLPEHSLASKAMAYAMGADYLEQDVVMTRDDRLVVLHDHYLDRVTNVAEVFTDRKREDGRYYVIDFDLDEIRQLEMTEGFRVVDGEAEANYKGRFPIWQSSFRVNTLQEEIEMIQGLNKSTGMDIGIYPEIKSPWFHWHEGKDISRAVLEVLKEFGYTTKEDKVFLQCFSPSELQRIRRDLFPVYNMDLKLVQLIAMSTWGETKSYINGQFIDYDYNWMFMEDGMSKISEYADGVGPWFPMIVKNESTKDNIQITDLVKNAHASSMEVHPYTFRADTGMVPDYADNFEDLLDIFLNQANVDGVFTDFPDRAVQFLRATD